MNPYDVLGVDKGATYQEIKKKWRKLSHELHPDKNQDEKNAMEDFQELQRAWEILRDPILRKMYDDKGRVEESKVSQSIYNEIHTYFFNCINKTKDAHEKDIISIMLMDIEDALANVKGKVPDINRAIENLMKLKGKIKRKDGKEHDNIFEDLINGKIEQFETEKKFWVELPANLNKLKDAVEQYECNTKRDFSKMGKLPDSML